MEAIELEPPPSMQLTANWQDMTDAVAHWMAPLWIILAAAPSRERRPVSVNGVTAQAWKTRGKGASRGIFLHLLNGQAHILVNYTTRQIRLHP